MDFASILDQWEQQTAKPAGKKAAAAQTLESERGAEPAQTVNPMSAWMRVHGIEDKDSEAEASRERAAERRRRLLAKAADGTIDLHGLTRDEAWEQLEQFFALAHTNAWEKVLVIHGKGNNSEGEAVLKRMTQQFFERCPWAGESGHASAKDGGSGASWVLLKDGK